MRHGAPAALKRIFDGIHRLRKREVYGKAFEEPKRTFPIDGRLVGDIGEAIAAVDYGVKLHRSQQKGTDGTYLKKNGVLQAAAGSQNLANFKVIPPTPPAS